MYSQNNEDEIISTYFGDYKGTLLDIGANDGETLSNSRLLIQQGWGASLVEPSLTCLKKLNDLYSLQTAVQIIPFAVSDYCGMADFWESGEHINGNDTSLISTLHETELERWKGTKHHNHVKKRTEVIDVKKLLELSEISQFDFISIDAEGVDVLILKQLDLTDVSLICIEWNGNQEVKREILEYCEGFNLHHENGENLILTSE